ncbi:MAG: PAS domain S-box protein, partial [Dehalococcoidia bacterium]|nr:PAS domain S-box protein [Dehalococcoidia bacterium]
MNLITRLKQSFTRADASSEQHLPAGTGHKQADVEMPRENEDIYRHLVEQADDGIAIIQDEIIRYANPASLKILGYTPRETIGTPIARYIHPDALDEVIDRYQKRMSGKDVPSRYESAFLHKDGRKVPVEINASATFFNNKPADLVIVRDITERMLIEQVLRESEQKYRTLIENSSINLFILDRDGIFQTMNASGAALFGGKPADFIGKSLFDLNPRDIAEEYYESNRRTIETGIGHIYERDWDFPTGRKTMLVTEQVLKDTNGNNIALQSSSIDITERKQAEEAIRENEHFITATLDDLVTFASVLKPDGEIIYSNNTGLKLIGKSIEQVRGVKFCDMDWWTYSPETQRLIREDLERCAAGERILREVEVYTQDGYIWIEFSIHPVFDENGAVKYLIPEGRDVTTSKRSRDALRESEERFSKAFRSSPNLMAISTLTDGRLIDVNNAFCAATGHSREDVINRTVSDIDLWADPGQRLVMVEKIQLNGRIHNMEVDLQTKSGEIRHILFAGETATLDGEPRLISVVTDVTERKLLEQALQESNRQLNTQNEELRASEEALKSEIMATNKARAYSEGLINSMSDGLIVLDMQGTVIDINDGYAKMIGFKKGEIVGMPLRKLAGAIGQLSSGEFETGFSRIDQFLSGGEIEDTEIAFLTISGEPRNASVSYRIVRTPEGQPLMVLLALRDITEHKQMEEKLRHSEEHFRAIFEQSTSGKCLVTPDGKFLMVNDSFAAMLGYNKQELSGLNFADITHPDDLDETKKCVRCLLAGERETYRAEIRYIHHQGHTVWTIAGTTLLRDSKGAPQCFMVSVQDITERQRAEQALHASEANFRNSLESSPLGVRIVSTNGDFLYINRTLLNIYGYDSVEEFKNIPLEKRYTPESYAAVEERKRKRRRGEFIPLDYEVDIVRKNGEIRHLLTHTSEVLWNGEKQFQTVYEDITERKQAEENIRHTNIELEKAFEQLNASQEQLLQSAKLAAVGELVAGVAHEINNPLMAISGYAQLLLD